MMGTTWNHQPVELDCGCVVVPTWADGSALKSGGTIVDCAHGIRHGVNVAAVTIEVAYVAERLGLDRTGELCLRLETTGRCHEVLRAGTEGAAWECRGGHRWSSTMQRVETADA